MFEPFSERARAKINLALHVLGRRADGYHDLDSIVAFADLGDELFISPAQHFAITTGGPFAADLPPTDDNIIAKAWAKMRLLLPDLPPAAVHLTKNLPVASGIGGGSANAAATIRAALRLAGITQYSGEIMALALSLGADVPVCLLGKACRMQGAGERITPLDTFKPLHAMLVNPGIAVSTLDVFRKLGLERGQQFGTPIIDPASWRNDLTAPAIALAPVIGEVLATLGLPHLALHPGFRGSEEIARFPAVERGTQESGTPAFAGVTEVVSDIDSFPKVRHASESWHPATFGSSQRQKQLGHGLLRRDDGPGPPFAGMSGSGATCYCVVGGASEADVLLSSIRRLHPDWWVVRATVS